MRTTIELPQDLHAAASRLARDRGQSLSRTVSDLVRAGLRPRSEETLEIDPETGFPLVRLGRPVTDEEVKAFLDED